MPWLWEARLSATGAELGKVSPVLGLADHERSSPPTGRLLDTRGPPSPSRLLLQGAQKFAMVAQHPSPRPAASCEPRRASEGSHIPHAHVADSASNHLVQEVRKPVLILDRLSFS